jgi:SMC interacting uncharacterized protein involved in chromosome segregation
MSGQNQFSLFQSIRDYEIEIRKKNKEIEKLQDTIKKLKVELRKQRIEREKFTAVEDIYKGLCINL